MEAEVNSQLGRSRIAMKDKKPRLHLCLGYSLVSSKEWLVYSADSILTGLGASLRILDG